MSGISHLCAAAANICPSGTQMGYMGCIASIADYQGLCPCNKSVGNPINVVSGNKYEEVSDFASVGSDMLAATRFYNSDQNYIVSQPASYSRFGFGWRSMYDSRIMGGSPSSASSADLVMADGNPVHFLKSGSAWATAYWDTSTGWQSPRNDVDLRLSTDSSYWYVTDQNDTVWKFGSDGKLVSITYRNGYQQNLTYDSSGNNTVVGDTFGRQLTFTYLANGLVDTMTDPLSHVTHYTYVERSGITPAPSPGTPGIWVLQTVTFPDSTSITYLYEDTTAINRFALTGITDENGNRYATWAYDANGRAVSSQHAGGADLTTVSYDDTHVTRTVTNPLTKQTIYSLSSFEGSLQIDSIDQQASTHSAASNTVYAYDSNGYVSQKTDGNGNVTTYVNNSIGQQTSRTEGYGSPVARTITTTWDSAFRVPDEIAEPNLTTDFTYDSSGNLTQLKLTDTTAPRSVYPLQHQWPDPDLGIYLLPPVDCCTPLKVRYQGAGDTVTYGYNLIRLRQFGYRPTRSRHQHHIHQWPRRSR